MKTSLRKKTPSGTPSPLAVLPEQQAIVLPARARTLRYTGPILRAASERILQSMNRLMDKAPEKEIGLFITSPGGHTGSAMSFYDSVRHIIRPQLVTIGSGDVDSSGIIIFLSGTRRYITNRTTLLLHPAGRMFGSQRYTTKEMQAMLAEDRIKDQQYAALVADNSHGKLMMEEVLYMMEQHTVLTPERMFELGLIDGILA